MEAVHHRAAETARPVRDLIPPGGIMLTPRHYAYVKIAEAAITAALLHLRRCAAIW